MKRVSGDGAAIEGRSACYRRQDGFSLIELLISLGILSLFMVAIYTILLSQTRSYTTQEVAAGAQQSARIAMEFLVNDLRLAGLNPLKTANTGFESALTTSFRVTSDRVAPGDFEANGQIDNDNFERITYFYNAVSDRLEQRLYEGTPFQDTQTLIENVSGLSFRYFDQDGAETDQLTEIRSVEIVLSVREPAGLDGMVSRTYNTRVRCRNLGL
jgi:type IV pilus assembly protein PilW